jgi:hypothetical protein
MGTRNLTCVQLDGEYKVAQYGQWDGYPTGQGKTILKFLKTLAKTKKARKEFETKLRASRFATPEDIDEANTYIKAEFPNGGWQQQLPQYSRDTAAEILQWIMGQEPGVILQSNLSFAADSVFCEYAYVIDLDTDRLEVYKGFNKRKLASTARFANVAVETDAEPTGKDYYPIRLKKTYELTSLPTVEQMDKDVG